MNDEFELIFKERKREIVFIWICNIGAEKSWHPNNDITLNLSNKDFINRIGEINLLLCKKQDYMILPQKTCGIFFNKAKEWGIEQPMIITPQLSNPSLSLTQLILKDRELLTMLKEIGKSNAFLIPYAVTNEIEKIAEICNLKVIGACSNIARKINDKVFIREVSNKLCFPNIEGEIITTEEKLNYLCNHLDKNAKYVIKYPYGASGEGIFIIKNYNQIKAIQLFLKRRHIGYPLILERWYESKRDINYQIYISSSGDIKLFSIKEQLTKGVIYYGSNYPVKLSTRISSEYINYAEKIGKYLFGLGYYGVLSIDSIIIQEDIVIPLVDVNARFSLSTYFSFLADNSYNMSFRQYDIYVDHCYSYEEIVEIFESCCINTKILVCAPSLLTMQSKRTNNKYFGRVMILAKSDFRNDLLQSCEKIKLAIQNLR